MRFKHLMDASIVVAAVIAGIFIGLNLRPDSFKIDVVQMLQDMPIGAMYLDKAHDTIWTKPQNTVISFLRIPDPEQAQMIRDFSPGNIAGQQQAPESTTTTTIPAGKGK